MTPRWPLVPLRVITREAQTGPFGSQLHAEEYVEGGVPVINPSNIVGGRVVPDPRVTIDGSVADRLKRHRLELGDVIFARRGELGRAAVVANDATGWICGTGSLRVRLRPGILHAPFVGYVLQSLTVRDYFIRQAVGSTMENLNTQIVLGLPVPSPELGEQRRIADFLDAETSRIEAIVAYRRHQMSIIRAWEPSLLNELTRLAAAPKVRVKYLSSHITSGPRGWGDYVADEGSLFLRIANIPRRGIGLLMHDLVFVDPPSGAERERTRTKDGDVLISITADIGSVGVVDRRTVDANVSQHVALVRPLPSVCDPRWLAYSMKAPVATDFLRVSSDGGTKVGLGLADVGELAISLPPLEQQKSRVAQISRSLSKVDGLCLAIERQLSMLEERKRTLITAAVTGQFDVSTARGWRCREL